MLVGPDRCGPNPRGEIWRLCLVIRWQEEDLGGVINQGNRLLLVQGPDQVAIKAREQFITWRRGLWVAQSGSKQQRRRAGVGASPLLSYTPWTQVGHLCGSHLTDRAALYEQLTGSVSVAYLGRWVPHWGHVQHHTPGRVILLSHLTWLIDVCPYTERLVDLSWAAQEVLVSGAALPTGGRRGLDSLSDIPVNRVTLWELGVPYSS